VNSWKLIGQPQWGDWLHEKRWVQQLADRCDDPQNLEKYPPYTLSPLLGLPDPDRQGCVSFQAGTKAWLRVTAMLPQLSAALLEPESGWVHRLPETISLYKNQWRVVGRHTAPEQHFAARQQSIEDLRAALDNPTPPGAWRASFLSPTGFAGESYGEQQTFFLFPLPHLMIKSWREAWNLYGPFVIPIEVVQAAEKLLKITGYELWTRKVVRVHSNPKTGHKEVIPTDGWLGRATIQAFGEIFYRPYWDLLAQFAIYRGTGHHTTQGFGQTLVISENEAR